MEEQVDGEQKEAIQTSHTELEQKIAGFLDGDGGIRESGGAIEVSASQSSDLGEPEELKMLQKAFPKGKIYKSKEAQDLMERCCIIKLPQAKAGLAFLAEVKRLKEERLRTNSSAVTKEEKKLRENCRRELTDLKANYQLVKVDETRLTPSYIVGFFMAEGCARITELFPLRIFCTNHNLIDKTSHHWHSLRKGCRRT